MLHVLCCFKREIFVLFIRRGFSILTQKRACFKMGEVP